MNQRLTPATALLLTLPPLLGLGVQRVGPAVAGFFSNLTPLFAALLSVAFLGELSHSYHALAFALIVGGIVVSAQR